MISKSISSGSKISLIVVFYNAEKYLNRAIKSFYDYLSSDVSVLFVNDGSTDSSNEVIKSWKSLMDFDYYELSENKGTSYARQYGIERSQNDIIMFMDADDEWITNPFVDVIQAFSNPHVDALYFRSINELSEEDPPFNHQELTGERFYQKMLKESAFLVPFWRYAFRKKLFYPRVLTLEYQLFEDALSTPIIVYRANSIRFLDKVYYKHYQNIPTSSVNTHRVNFSNTSHPLIQKKIELTITRIHHIHNHLHMHLSKENLAYLKRYIIQLMLSIMSVNSRMTLQEYNNYLKTISIKKPRVFMNLKVAFKNKHLKINIMLFLTGLKVSALIYKYYLMLKMKRNPNA